jgi:hypothetical protein
MSTKVKPQRRAGRDLRCHSRFPADGRFEIVAGSPAKVVCRWSVSRVLSATASCHGRSFVYDADCSTPPAAYPKVGRFGPNRVRPKTHSLLLSFAPDEVYPADSVTKTAGALLPHRFTLTWEAVTNFASRNPSKRKPFRRFAFCCTCSILADGGRYPPSCPLEPGLSSPPAK